MNSKIKEKISYADLVDLTCKMIAFDTTNPPGNEKPLAEFLQTILEQNGFTTELDILSDNRANLTARLQGSGERKALLFNGHLDVVPVGKNPWKNPPFEGIVANETIYGRGASDMKSGLAAMIIAAIAIKKSGLKVKGDLIIACSAGEETDSIGAKTFLKKGGLKGVGAIVVGEPSSCGINIAEKGCLWVKVTTFGKTAHGAFPHEGINAILAMNAFLSKLQDYSFSFQESAMLTAPTMNIATISGGVKTNVVPDKCELTIDIRTVPGQDHTKIVQDINDICSSIKAINPLFEACAEAINDRSAIETSSTDPFVTLCQGVIKEEFGRNEEPKGVNFFTDAAIFLPSTNLPAVLYGPGDASMAHQPEEHVRIDRLNEAANFYAAVIERYLVM